MKSTSDYGFWIVWKFTVISQNSWTVEFTNNIISLTSSLPLFLYNTFSLNLSLSYLSLLLSIYLSLSSHKFHILK